MQKISVKIRGIYTTALTCLLLDNKYSQIYSLVQPSPKIRKRFQITGNKIPEDIFIRDREDHQGLLLSGKKDHLHLLISLFKDHFFDMVVRTKYPKNFHSHNSADLLNTSEVEIEFPGTSKAALDSLRARITPTVKYHHLIRIIASDRLELAEKELYQISYPKEELEKKLQEDVIFGPMRKEESIGLIHVTPEGMVLKLRPGKILSLKNDKLIIRRDFSGGHGLYDGLDLPIEEEDYGISEITENQWGVKHSYYSRQGRLKGIYWNINTPIEFYPDHIRYLDLHIDVIQKPGESPKLIDQEKLERSVAAGFITRELAQKAYEIAYSLMHCLLAESDIPPSKI